MKRFWMLYRKENRRLRSFFITLLSVYILGNVSIIFASIVKNKQDYLVFYYLITLAWFLFPFMLESSYKSERIHNTTCQQLSLPVRKYILVLSKHIAVLGLYVFFLVVSYSLAKLTILISHKYVVLAIWDYPYSDLNTLYISLNMDIAIFSFLFISLVTFIESFRAVFKKYQNVLCGITGVVCLIFIFWLYVLLPFHSRLQYALFIVIVGSILTCTSLLLFEKFGEV